jgi:hypothetical protein
VTKRTTVIAIIPARIAVQAQTTHSGKGFSKSLTPVKINDELVWQKSFFTSGELVKDESFQEEDKMSNKEERSDSHKHTKERIRIFKKLNSLLVANVFIIFSGADDGQEAP